jgi:hypothetical protein
VHALGFLSRHHTEEDALALSNIHIKHRTVGNTL